MSITSDDLAQLVEFLLQQAPLEATGSRDFGRGFSHCITVLKTAPVTDVRLDFTPKLVQ